jgi:8-oxo-dGTP pyrophosphatase MutT (NUDIX family)
MARMFEKSSWGIVYRKNWKDIEILLLEWMNAKGNIIYVIPKWHIEDEETAKDTALREIWEETWLDEKDLEIIKFIAKINYTFVASHVKWSPTVNKDVYLFLVRYSGNKTPVPPQSERFSWWYKWFRIDELKQLEIKPDIYGFIRKNLQYM